jgi:uncharacterized protein (DUF362 family)
LIESPVNNRRRGNQRAAPDPVIDRFEEYLPEKTMKALCRRSFIKKTTLLGAGTLLGDNLVWRFLKDNPQLALAETGVPDVVAVKGKDYFANTINVVEQLGGIEAFVKRGDRVGLLVNSAFKNLGASVNPDIVLAAVQMCRDAGAKEIRYLKDPHKGYWDRTEVSRKRTGLTKELIYESGDHVKTDIPEGIKLKDAKVSKDLMACDVFINISITKHHKGVDFTGSLKNMMGLCPFSTNSYFHFGTLKLGWYKDIDHLSQCIADLNLVRKPDLCLSDATAFITENGPWGPGVLKRPETVVGSLSRVSLDAYCCQLLDLQPENVLMIQKAARHGMGEMDLQKLRIKTLTL